MELGEPSLESNGMLDDIHDAGHAWGEWLPDPSKGLCRRRKPGFATTSSTSGKLCSLWESKAADVDFESLTI